MRVYKTPVSLSTFQSRVGATMRRLFRHRRRVTSGFSRPATFSPSRPASRSTRRDIPAIFRGAPGISDTSKKHHSLTLLRSNCALLHLPLLRATPPSLTATIADPRKDVAAHPLDAPFFSYDATAIKIPIALEWKTAARCKLVVAISKKAVK